MQLNYKKWLAACASGALGLAGASAAQAQVRVSPYINITVGAPLVQGEYGRIRMDSGVPTPPLHSSRPVVIGRPVARATPVYLYVPSSHRKNWGKHCHRYGACRQSVYFVDGKNAARYQPARVVHDRRVAERHPADHRRHPTARPQPSRSHDWEHRRRH